MLFLKLEHTPQEVESGCLAACVQMILKHYGLNYSQTDLNQLFDLTPLGVPYSRLKRLSQYGVQVKILTGDLADILQAIKQGQPPILFVGTGQLSYWLDDIRHAIVVVGYDGDTIFLHDPAFADAPKQVKPAELMLAWDEFDNTYAVLELPNLQKKS